MTIGWARFRLSIAGVGSLKAKRRVVKSLKDRLRNRFNISVSEVDEQDVWQTAVLGVVSVGPDTAYIQGQLEAVVRFVDEDRDVQILDCRTECMVV